MNEEEILMLFQRVNVRIGDLNPCIIKAWFDTDCDHLLRWICSSVTTGCHMSAQEASEFNHLDCVLTGSQLNKKIIAIEEEFPELLQVDSNLCNIEVAKYTVDMLEEDLENYDHQLQVNQQLNESLLAEYSKISSSEIQSQLEQESAQATCMKLSEQLDTINSQAFDQILKYNAYLSNYQFAEFPSFANNVDIRDFEENFLSIVNSPHSATKIDDDLLEISTPKYINTLSELEISLFQSKISQLALQMETEGLNSALKFLDNYEVNTSLSFIDYESVRRSADCNRDKQTWMLKELEESCSKLVEYYMTKPIIRCSENELECFKSKLNDLIKSKDVLLKILIHSITIYNLYFQEKIDIKNSSLFFRNISKYINKDLQNSNHRKKALLQLISDYEQFCSRPTENKFNIVQDFGVILIKNRNLKATEILEETVSIRDNKEKLKKQQFSPFTSNVDITQKLLANVQMLKDFLICGPTCQPIVIPCSLQMLLLRVNKNLEGLNSAVKLLIQSAQKPKEKLKSKAVRHRTLLWMYFLTDGRKMLSFLDQIKADAVCLPEKTV